MKNKETAGTTGRALRMEAVQIKLTGAAALGAGIPLWIKGNKKLNAIADDYNQRYGGKAYGYSPSLSVGTTGNGIGLALNF